MSQASGTDDAEDQLSYNAEQPPPQIDAVGLIEEEKINIPLSELSSWFSNAGPSQPLGSHVQKSIFNVPPVSGLAPEGGKVVADKDQPTLSELANVMKQVLDILQDSTIASKIGKDKRSRFWGVYKRVAEEHDGEFLERYTTDMDIVLIFSGLFSAVSTGFIVAMESNLNPDPSDTTNALLKQIVQIGLGNLAEAGTAPVDPGSTWSPSALAVRIQMIAYASLSMSLLAAFGAVLGKQWLGYYKSNRYGRGSEEERGKRRQEKFDGIVTWYFDAVVQCFPVILQISLLLFGIALGANMWYEQRSIAWVIIATTVFGFLFYSLTVMACLISPACPFQTPTSTMLRMFHIDRVLRLVFKRASSYSQQLTKSLHDVLARLVDIVRPGWNRLSQVSRGPVRAIGAFVQRSLQQSIASLHNWLRFVPRFSTKVVDSEAQLLAPNLDVSWENEYALTFPDIPTSNLEAPSVKWLLETSTDPEVYLAAASLVPQVEWPLDLDVSDMLHQLYDIYTSCVGFDGLIMPSLEENASACLLAMSHLYCGHVLKAHPTSGKFLGCRERDYDTFDQMFQRNIKDVDQTVLIVTMNLCLPQDDDHSSPWELYGSSNSVMEWLSHSLPYHFVIGRVNENVQQLATDVILQLLSSPSSPSNQILANCALLACVMVGVQFDKKDIVRIDKSSALPRFANALLEQFQTTLWAWYGGDLSDDSTGITYREADLIKSICLVLESAKNYYNPSSHAMRNLDVCRKIYSRMRSSRAEQNSPQWKLLGDLQNTLRFTLTAAKVIRSAADLWNSHFRIGDSHSSEDFDWLVDYLEDVGFDDQEAIYDILFLMHSLKVRSSLTKEDQFWKIIDCMGSSMPAHLRHAALCIAHSAREEMVSIDAIDDAELRDMILTKFSSAIMTAVCPQPGVTLSDDDLGYFVRAKRDLCYLELLFALARNSNWHPQLVEDHHIDRCISMVAKYYESHAFYLAGIFLRIAPEQSSAISLDSITEHQWWYMMRSAWLYARFKTDDIHCFEFLPVLVEGTKRYMHIALEFDLKTFIGRVDDVLNALERRDSQQGEGESVAVAVRELRTAASDMLEKLVSSQGVVSP